MSTPRGLSTILLLRAKTVSDTIESIKFCQVADITSENLSERDENWLKNRFTLLWQMHFSDIALKNIDNIKIRFGRNAYTRLGSISYEKKSDRKITLITITGYFKNQEIPQYVIDATIAHEICHYAHGFFSPFPKSSKYPHKGGKVDRELIDRGLGEILKKQKIWMKNNWKEIVKDDIKMKRKRRKNFPKRYGFARLIYNIIEG